MVVVPCLKKPGPYDIPEQLCQNIRVIHDFFLHCPTVCEKNWHGSRTTCMISIETVS